MDSSNLIAIIKSVNRGIQDKIGNHTQMQVEHEEEYFLDSPGLHDSSCNVIKKPMISYILGGVSHFKEC